MATVSLTTKRNADLDHRDGLAKRVKTLIENDEALLTEVDKVGKTKVDINRSLLGGREYWCQTFHYP
jgi:hypothetical protein